MKTVLSFGAHPDDIEIGCGGTELVLASQGYSLVHAIVTSGEAGDRDVAPSVLAETREAEARAAARVLGARETGFLRFPDGLTGYTREMKLEVIRLIRRVRPEVVFVHAASDTFPDHRVVHELVLAALTAASGPWYPEVREAPHAVPHVYGYEVWHPIQAVQAFVDISKTLERKMEAIRCHRSQVKSVAYDEAFLGLARYRGAMSFKSSHAEAFEVLKSEVLPC